MRRPSIVSVPLVLVALMLISSTTVGSRPLARASGDVPAEAISNTITAPGSPRARVSGDPDSLITWFGAVDAGGTATPGGRWTFDHGAPGLEGWTIIDPWGDNAFLAGRRVTGAEWEARGGTPGGAPTFGTTGSLWFGFYPNEADSACFDAGAGYGNYWAQELRSPVFQPVNPFISVQFSFYNDTEDGYDFTRVLVRNLTDATEQQLLSITGSFGTPSSPVAGGVGLPWWRVMTTSSSSSSDPIRRIPTRTASTQRPRAALPSTT